VLNELYRQVSEGAVAQDKNGNSTRLSPSAAVINAATNFLKAFPPETNRPQPGAISPSLQKYGSKVAGLRKKSPITK
jgi:hypothetical protein